MRCCAMNDPSDVERLAQLRRERDEVEASLPAHSVPASMLIRLEGLEDEIAALEAALADLDKRNDS